MKFTLTETYNNKGIYSDREEIISIDTIEELIALLEKENPDGEIVIGKNKRFKNDTKYIIEIYNGYRE